MVSGTNGFDPEASGISLLWLPWIFLELKETGICNPSSFLFMLDMYHISDVPSKCNWLLLLATEGTEHESESKGSRRRGEG